MRCASVHKYTLKGTSPSSRTTYARTVVRAAGWRFGLSVIASGMLMAGCGAAAVKQTKGHLRGFAALTPNEQAIYRQAYRTCMSYIAKAPPGVFPKQEASYMKARAFPKSDMQGIEYEGCGDANTRTPLPGSHLPTNF